MNFNKETKKCVACSTELTGIKRKYCSPKCNSSTWYRINRDYAINHTKEYQKKTNYASEKTPEQRKLRYIKRRTRMLHPLFKAIKCEFCENGSVEHHHNSEPIQVDNFNFVCHPCHVERNMELQGGYVLK